MLSLSEIRGQLLSQFQGDGKTSTGFAAGTLESLLSVINSIYAQFSVILPVDVSDA